MIYNEDCISGSFKLANDSIDLMICDPPFGINESSFDRHYNRKENFVMEGYVEAPKDYFGFSVAWIEQAKRLMKPDAAMYIISGWSNLKCILNAVDQVGLKTINHLIWKFNFGVATKNKYVTSHYHVLYLKKSLNPKFNTYCRFGSQEKDKNGKSLNYQDLEDVFCINKEFTPGQKKNKNKLPDALLEKLILYSSNPGDNVCDLFLGNFTTASVAKKLGRNVFGFELNKESFDYHLSELNKIEFGSGLKSLKQVVNEKPVNQGKKITEIERAAILAEFKLKIKSGFSKKSTVEFLMEAYGRGKFSILNIVE